MLLLGQKIQAATKSTKKIIREASEKIAGSREAEKLQIKREVENLEAPDQQRSRQTR